MNAFTDFDLKLLKVFKAIADNGGLSKAETALNMNLSMISTYLSDLESRLGLNLCTRGRSGFQLTPEGRSLYQAMDTVLGSIEEFKVEISKIKNQISGELSIGVVDNTLSDDRLCLSQALKAVKEIPGKLFIKLEIKSPRQIEDELLSKALNIGIGPFQKYHPQLAYETLHEETLNLYCGAGHPLFGYDRSQPEIPLDRLKGLEYVSRGYLREVKLCSALEYFSVAATVHNMEAVAVLILSGKFVGYLPDHYVEQWISSGRMRIINPSIFSQRVQFCIATRKDIEKSFCVHAFMQAMRGARLPHKEKKLAAPTDA